MLGSNPWVEKLGFVVSEEDRILLSTQFHVRDPQSLPNLLRDIPDGIAVEAVEFAYHVAATHRQRSRWIRCCECGRDRNHKRGVVLRLADGNRVTIGRDCGREEHQVDFDELIKEFDVRLHRARLLRQTIVTLEQLPGIREFLHTLRTHPALLAALSVRREIASRLPELSRRLQGAEGGRITGNVKVRDLDAERQRDDRLERKLADLALRRGVSRDGDGADKALLAELAAGGDQDTSKAPIQKLERREVHRFVGHGFYSVLPQARLQAERLNQRLQACFGGLEGKESKSVTDRRMELVRKEFYAVVDEAERLHGEVRDALAFTEPANVTGFVQANNTFYLQDDVRHVVYEDGILRNAAAPGEAAVDLRLPEFMMSAAALDKVKQAIRDAFTDDEKIEEGEVGT